MPTYEYHCNSCETNFDRILKIAEMDQPLEEPCPHCKEKSIIRVVGGSYAFMSPEALGRKKPPEDFRELLRKIKKANPDGYIRDR